MASTDSSSAPPSPPQKQPRALAMLFFAEMWERFSFYGMRALLTLYLVRQLFADMGETESDQKAKGIYAAYGALVYATPFLGGLIADRLLGYKRSVMLGAVLMAIGHFVMAIETEFMLYVALAFLIAGNGFFKPNISSMVGGLYEDRNDPRRDRGFTIFYMGINLGAWLAPLACGYLGETYGWSWGFGLAGVGMIAGLIVFGLGQNGLGKNGDPPDMELLKKPVAGIPFEYLTYVLAFISVAGFGVLIRYYHVMTFVLTPFALLVVGIIFVEAIRSEKIVRERLFVVLVLLFFTTLFWAFFEQAGSSLTLFTDTNVDRLGVPASLFQSVNPLFILIFAPVFTMIWAGLNKRGIEPNIPVKFALGILQLGLGFLVLGWCGSFASAGEIEIGAGDDARTVTAALVPVAFLLIGYLLHTTGELCLSPIGLSMVTKLSPKKITAMVMGGWFLSSAMAHHLAGLIALMTTPPETDADPGQLAIDSGLLEGAGDLAAPVLTSYDNLANYLTVFEQIGYVACGAAVLCFVLSPVLKKWMHLDADSEEEKAEAAKTDSDAEPSTF